MVPGRDVRMEAGELFSCRMAGPRTSSGIPSKFTAESLFEAGVLAVAHSGKRDL